MTEAVTRSKSKVFWTLASLAAMGGSLFLSLVASALWDLYGRDDTWFLVWALCGVPPTFVALAMSIDGRGHPGRWISASAAVYVAWYLTISGAFGS